MAKNILLYKASAGSGKTFTLVSEYLKSALRHPLHYKSILAITFTNKATAEMKDRIISYLHGLSHGDAHDMLQNLQSSLPADINIQERATELLKLILHDYSNFSVMTIDSFFSMLLKSFAYELQLPPDLNILLHQKTALEYSVEQLIADYTHNKYTEKWLLEFVEDKISQGKKWKIEYDIRNLSAELLKENLAFADDEDEDTLRALIKQCYAVIIRYETTLSELADSILKRIEQERLTHVYNKFFISFLKKILHQEIDVNATIQKIIRGETEPYNKSSDTSLLEAASLLWHGTLQAQLHALIDFHQQNLEAYNTAKLVKKNFYSYILLRDINKKLQTYRHQEELILIHDINQLIAQLVKTDTVPFIYEKAGLRYNTILIDEFQDTSDVQWQNMLPLLLELLAKGGDKILVVGDAKQSIYRWRGGNLDLILSNIYGDLLPFSKDQLSDQTLLTNYRSHEAIVAFNNIIFSNAIKYLPEYSGKTTHIYASSSQQCKPSHKDKGLVSIDFYTPWRSKKDITQDEKAILEQEYLNHTLQRIHEALEDGYQYGDIAILVSKNKETTYFANYLMGHSIPVLSSEALLFAEHPIVDGLIAAIYHIQHPKESLYYLSLLKKMVSILDLPYSIDEFILQPEIQQKILPKERLLHLKYLPLQRIFLHLLQFVFPIEIDEIAAQFLDIAHNRRINAIDDFLLFWEEEGYKLTANNSRSNAVQLLTIHKSKGLEFPVVILPKLEWTFNEFSTMLKPKYLWLSTDKEPYRILKKHPIEYSKIMGDSIYRSDFMKEMEYQQLDVFNKLYVALTRAAHRLHIIIPKQKGAKEYNTTDKLLFRTLQEALDIDDSTPFIYGNRLCNECPDIQKGDLEIHISLPPSSSRFLYRPMPYQDDMTQKGEVFHTILSQLHNDENIHSLITKTLHSYKLPLITLSQYSEPIYQLLAHPQWKTWGKRYSQKIVEREMIWEGKIIRPDLFFVGEEDITLVDYKTGHPDNAHAKQVKEYAAALKGIFDKKIFSYILYTYPEIDIVEVT